METVLENYRVEQGLTYDAMAAAAGVSNRSVVQRQAKGTMPISGEFALRYHKAFGIPLEALRPDIFAEDSQPQDAA
jgi:transcriptional regulator with XRE-family HTH domain